jgi:large conductance mechanosensitive channel
VPDHPPQAGHGMSTVSSAGSDGGDMLRDFQAFLFKTNAMALAIGVIIGAALGTVVSSLVNDVIMPPIGLLLGDVDFSELKIILRPQSVSGDEVAIRYGVFINSVITFLVIAFVVYLISRRFIPPEPAPAETRTCPYCREPVSIDATKCKFCTSQLTPDAASA